MMPRPRSQTAQAVEPEPAALALDGLDSLLGFRLRVAYGVMHRDFIASLAHVQISQGQTGAMWVIGANPGMSQAELAEALMMDRATIVGLIDRLEADGRVIRIRSTRDRRRVALHLTPKGVKALALARSAIAKHEQRFVHLLGEQDFATLMNCLERIAGARGRN